jgi:putative toxin-antitoxin system antitoxin component (TIGR02293 family)
MNVADERKAAAIKAGSGAKKVAPTKAKSASSLLPKTAAPIKSSRTGRNPRAGHVISAGDTLLLKTFSTVHPRKKVRAISAASLLGLESDERKVHLTSMEWVSAIRRGIPSSAVDALTAFLLVSQTEFSDALDIPVRTLVRRKGEGLLNSEESAKLVRVARVIQRAEEVFDDPDSARDWLKTSNTSLGGETPMSLLDTEIGAEAVTDTLGRIEHGVFA